jgi:Spy/CpxP family protein refolding chaperone
MKSHNRFSLLFALLCLVMVASLQAQSPDNNRSGKNKEFGKKNFLKSLNLSVEQKEKIAGLKIAHGKDIIDLKADVAKLELDKKELIRKGNIDRKTVVDLEEKLIKLQNKIRISGLNHKLDIYELLTPEQKEKIKTGEFWGGKHHEKGEMRGHQKQNLKKRNNQ